MMSTNNASEKLLQAIQYETEKQKLIPQKEKLTFHVMPPVGWMNDPNGFSNYQGEYHLFYQYHPYSKHWGPMHWAHCKTKDFIRWEQLPCALAPDMEYDGQGCFSGSAVEYEGKHILMYTGVKERQLSDGSREVRQTQCIAIGDGVSYVKVRENPVIKANMLPKGSSEVDFRDPKIWKEENSLFAVVGSKNEDGSGQIALFSSENAQDWKFESIIDRCHNQWGKMWECPDFFPLDGRQVLIVSPQFMQAKGLEIHNGNNSIYFVGDYDREKKKLIRDQAYQIDYGMDFYAPQTVEAADGRRIMIGWLQSWDNYLTPDEMKWSGMMTVPRELSVKGDRLIQVPVRELDNYRKNGVFCQEVRLNASEGEIQLTDVKGRCFDMTIEIEEGSYDSFSVLLACDDMFRTSLTYDRKKGIFTTDRTYCGMVRDLVSNRSMYVGSDKKIKIRVLMDKYTIEVFINDGEKTMTSLIYTPLKLDQIRFCCEGEVHFSVEKYDIIVEEK